MMETQKNGRAGGATVLGFPLEGFGLFQSLLLALASAFFTFFASTCPGDHCAAGMEFDWAPLGELCG